MTWVRVISETSRLKKTIPISRAKWSSVGVAEHARAVGDVDLAVEDRLDQPLHLGRQVLAVGVERDDDLRPRVDHQPVAGAQGGAAAAVDHVARHRGAVLGGDLPGPVARAVVDDQDPGRDPAYLVGDAVEHVADVLGLVVGRDEDRDACRGSAPEARPGGTRPQASPSSTAEISRELRAETRSARRIIRKRTKIANTARPRMRPPLPRSKEKASSSRSVSSVPETIASPTPPRAGSGRPRCAASGGGRSRRR